MTRGQFASSAQQITAIVSLLMALATAALIRTGGGPVWVAFLSGAAAFAIELFVMWEHEFYGDGDHAASHRYGNKKLVGALVYGLLLGTASAILFFAFAWLAMHIVYNYINLPYIVQLLFVVIGSGILLAIVPLVVIVGMSRYARIIPVL